MATKTISITEDELRRLAKSGGKITDCAGLWSKWMSKNDLDSIEKSIEKRRKASREAKKEKSGYNERGGHNFFNRSSQEMPEQ